MFFFSKTKKINKQNKNCEFQLYFFKAILALYLKYKLGYLENDATVLYHTTSVFVNFMCIFGGILSDVWLGRFKTICVLSIVYCFASTLISVSSIPMFIFSPNTALIIGLLLISIGAGGIMPCMSAFGADQFENMPDQNAYIATYFSLFYASLNTGAFLSHAIPPILRSDVQCFGQGDCYPLAFGVPALLLFIAMGMLSDSFRSDCVQNVLYNSFDVILALFLCGKSSYTHVKVSPANVLGQSCSCITVSAKCALDVLLIRGFQLFPHYFFLECNPNEISRRPHRSTQKPTRLFNRQIWQRASE